jgi:hypothetical protein
LTNLNPYGIISISKERKEDKKMKLYFKGMYLGKISANEYTVRELESAGFTVVIE